MSRKHAARTSREQYVDAVEISGDTPLRRREVRQQGRGERRLGSAGGSAPRKRKIRHELLRVKCKKFSCAARARGGEWCHKEGDRPPGRACMPGLNAWDGRKRGGKMRMKGEKLSHAHRTILCVLAESGIPLAHTVL